MNRVTRYSHLFVSDRHNAVSLSDVQEGMYGMWNVTGGTSARWCKKQGWEAGKSDQG